MVNKKSNIRLVFINYDEFMDLEKYPIIKSMSKDIEFDIKQRRNIFTNAVYFHLKKNAETISRKGFLLEITSEYAYMSLKKGLTYLDKNDKEICLIHELVDKTDLPLNISQYMELYQQIIAENMQLKAKIEKSEAKPEDIDKIKLEVYTEISKNLGNSFKQLFEINKKINNDELGLSINNVIDVMNQLKSKFKKEMK
jgi:hypothetical protein